MKVWERTSRKEIRMLDLDLQQVVKGCIPCLCSSASNQPSKCVFNCVKFVFKRERFSSLGLGHLPAISRKTCKMNSFPVLHKEIYTESVGKNYRKEIRMLDVDLQQVVKGCIPCLCSSASNQPSKCVFNSVKFVFKRERFSSLGLGHSPAVRRETPV